jgi:radical SAM protein with 4Fe4S-binding SPASM domain
MTKHPIINIIPVDVTDSFLKPKRNDREEFFINLFEYCNLSCSFCWQDHDSIIGMDSITTNAHNVINTIEQRGITAFDANVMGGELFCDEIDDSLFNDYKQFAKIIHEYASPRNIEFTITWVTNLIYHNTDRVIQLLHELRQEGIDTKITTSYDPTGRFNKQTLALFINNLDKFEDELQNVSVVLTKPNIRSILKDRDAVFVYLYNKYGIYVDYYSPEKNASTMAPSDSELLSVFYHFIDNYPKIGPIKDWIENHNNKLTCRSSNVILPTGETGKCRKLVNKKEQINFKSAIDIDDNTNMEHTFVTQHNCGTCEYFTRCGLGCFLLSDFMKRSELDECLFKITYDYITKGLRRDGF